MNAASLGPFVMVMVVNETSGVAEASGFESGGDWLGLEWLSINALMAWRLPSLVVHMSGDASPALASAAAIFAC